MAYKLELTESEIDTINFVGGRYCWSEALRRLCHEGLNELPEHVAWELLEAFNCDCEGGHNFFPMLDHWSDLAAKLFKFRDSII